MDCSLPGSFAHGIFQARVLERVAIGFSNIDSLGAKSQTRLSDFTFTFHFHALEKEMQPIPVFLPGESQGRQSLVGCPLWGRTESDMTEAT